MESFIRVKGVVAPLDRSDVDTDQIIPARYLKRLERTGFGEFLFAAWRFHPDGSVDPEFILNRPGYQGARILVTRQNFGSGSSREHAAWALLDYGFRALIAPSFADIFLSNCYQNGILPVTLPEGQVDQLIVKAMTSSDYEATVDLVQQEIYDEEGFRVSFEIDSFRRYCLMNGLDDIGLTLIHEERIASYERGHVIT